jgi:hypothetical protein
MMQDKPCAAQRRTPNEFSVVYDILGWDYVWFITFMKMEAVGSFENVGTHLYMYSSP